MLVFTKEKVKYKDYVPIQFSLPALQLLTEDPQLLSSLGSSCFQDPDELPEKDNNFKLQFQPQHLRILQAYIQFPLKIYGTAIFLFFTT